jgi:hypothetical protein
MQAYALKSHQGTGEGLNTHLRNELARRMNPKMFTCDFLTFRDHYLPFVPSDDEVQGAITELVERRILARSNLIDGYIWTVFGVPSSELPDGEQHIFVGLKDITTALAEYSMGDRLARYQYRSCPNTFVSSEVRRMTFKIDGCFETKYQIASTTIVTAHIAVILKHTALGEDKLEVNNVLLLCVLRLIAYRVGNNYCPLPTRSFTMTLDAQPFTAYAASNTASRIIYELLSRLHLKTIKCHSGFFLTRIQSYAKNSVSSW